MAGVQNDTRPIHFVNRTDEQGKPAGGYVTGEGFTIVWQEGVEERNGAFATEVLEAVMQRLGYYQTTKYANEYNEEAIDHIASAIHSLNKRLREREARNVAGTFEV